ncbi:MAG: PTS transporter subunit EIIC [Clostridium perfringens]|nr:PTS transporter subunit EIIC [Clostridium perfringens]
MSKFEKDAKLLTEYIGGKENVAAVTHQAGQFQVIIGPEVATFYNDFVGQTGVSGESKEEVKKAAKKNMNIVQRAVAGLAEIFAPLIPAIIVGGLILGFRNVIGDMKLFEGGTKTLVEISQFWAGTHSFLWLIGEAIFHFLPVGVVWSIAKKMGADQMLGIVIGITLVSPQLLNAYSAGNGATAPVWDFGFAQVPMIGYQAQVLPAIMVGFTFVYLERLFKKITPGPIQMIIVPFFSVIPTVLLAHTVLGPIGWKIGSVISGVIVAGLTSSFGWLFAGIFGMIYAPLVITGLHHTLLPVDLQLIRKQISIPACISGYLGVTEPAMFGVNLKYLYPFIAAMIGAGVSGMFSMAMGCMANSVGVGGLPAILSMQSSSMLMYLVAMGIAIVVPFVLTVVFSKTKLANMASK